MEIRQIKEASPPLCENGGGWPFWIGKMIFVWLSSECFVFDDGI